MLSTRNIGIMLSIDTNITEATMQSKMIQGPKGRLAYNELGAGHGTPVMFLHADAGRASQWTDMQSRIGGDRRTVAFDAHGCGASEPAGDGDYGYTGRAADVGAVVDALGLPRFVIVAHSGGAAVALRYAADNPSRVAGLLLVDPATDPRLLPQEMRDGFVRELAGPNGLEFLKTYYRSIAGSDPRALEQVLADCEAVVPAARAGFGAALAAWNPEPTLNAWRGPIEVLATAPNVHAGALFELRKDVRHETIADAGHWVQLDQPERIEKSIRKFIGEIEGERR